MRFRKYTAIIFAALLITACGSAAGGPQTLSVKTEDNGVLEVPVNSGGFYASTKSWSKPGKLSTSSSFFVCAANYDIDMSQGAISIGAKVTGPEQTKVCFSLNGEENGNDKTPLSVRSYKMEKRGGDFGFNSISSVTIRTFKDGKEIKRSMNGSRTNGEIKITSATSDEISGEIDLKDEDNEIKGTFTAKAFKRS